MSKEHPNERLVTDSKPADAGDSPLVTRRQALGLGTLGAGLLAYTSDPTDPLDPRTGRVVASDNPDEPLIILGEESSPVGYIFQDSAGGIIFQDATSGDHFWYNESQGRWETDAELNVPTLLATTTTIDDLVDGGGISHTGRLADLGEVFLASYNKTVGGGSVTDNSGVVEVREPGNASAGSESRIYSHIFEFDPSVSRKITANLQNITIDDSGTARIRVMIGDQPDTDDNPGDDVLGAFIEGDGTVGVFTSDDGTSSASENISQNNGYVSSLESVEVSWDGSSVTVTTDDGSTTVSVNKSSNYPGGETLHLKISASDDDSNSANNVDFDVDSVVIDQ